MNTESQIRRRLLGSFLVLSSVIVLLGTLFAARTALHVSKNNTTARLIGTTSIYLVELRARQPTCDAPDSLPFQDAATQPALAGTDVFLISNEGQVTPLSAGSLAHNALPLERLSEQATTEPDAWQSGIIDTDTAHLVWVTHSISDAPGCTLMAQAVAPRASDILTGKPAIWFLITSLIFLWFILWFSALLAHRINLQLRDQNAAALAQTLSLDETRRALALEQERGSLRSEFLAVTSHQFKTPLASIVAAADVLERHGAKLTDEQRTGRVTKIREQVSRLNDMVNSILELSRMANIAKEANFEEVQVDQIVNELADEQDDISSMTHPISRDLVPVIATLEPALFRQTVENLISNAVKYSPDGGVILLQLRTTEEKFCLKISDSGIGIPETDRASLFVPFKRASNVGTIKGTGIGLAIVDECVSLHGGDITVASAPGEGTSFALTFPNSQGKRT